MSEAAAQERADELAKANEALRRSLSSLTQAKELGNFLQAVLQEVVLTIAATSAAVFVYHAASHTLHAAAAILKGEVIDAATDPRFEIMRIVPADVSDLWRQMSENDKIYWFDNDAPPPEEWTFANEWHRQMGHRTLATIPLKVGTQVLGHLGLAFTELRQPTEIQLEQCEALAQQAALALQISRLSEEAKQSAIAREREQAAQERATELVNVNAALQRSLTTLTTTTSLQTFLRTVLQQTVYASDAITAAVFVLDAATNTLPLAEIVLRGEILDVDTDPRLAVWRAAPAFSFDFWTHILQKDQILWHDLDNPPFQIEDAVLDWHQQMGHEVLVWIPMFLQNQALGFLGLAFSRVTQPTENKLEQCRILAQHAALALQTARLSEEAKQAAIAREREQAAQERAAELAKTNTVLQRSLAVLVRSKTLEAFLPTVLQEAINISGAVTAAVFVYQPASETFTLIAQYVLGRMRGLKTDSEAHYWSNIPAKIQAVWKQMAQAENIHWYDNSNPPPDWDYEVEWNRLKGHHGIAGIPMLVDGQIIGLLRLAFVEAEHPEGKLEQCQFLAHQIALALCLSQLSEEAQQVAVARAEEKAAQERAAELTTINEALTQRDRLLSMIAQITQELLENPDVEQAIAQASQIMGRAVGASSVNLLQQKEDADTGRLYHHLIVEWTASQIARQSDELATSVVNNDDIIPLVTRLHAGETMNLYLEDYPEFLRSHLAQFGLKTSCVAPIFVEDYYFGCLCFDNYVDRRLWTAQEIEVLSAGAGVIGTALLRQRLVDRTMQTQAERERAAELAKANAAMNRILTLTTRETGIDSLLSSVLAAIAEQFDTPLAEWWEEIDATTFAKRLSYLNGRLLSPEEMQGHHGVPYFKLPTTIGTIEEVLGEIYLCEDIEQLPWDDVEMEKIRAWYGTQGFSKFLSVQVKVDNCSAGGMFVFLPADRSFTDTQIQFAFGMAQHLALAILVANRAEEAKQAVIAREREQAAQAQAAELAEINEALTQRDRLLAVVAQITQELLENPNTEEAIFQAMEKLGQAAGASRINVLQERLEAQTGRLQHHVNLEWTIPNVPCQIDDPDTKVVNNDDFTEIFATLHAGGSVCLYLEEYPTPVQPYLARIAIKVSGIAPIFMGSEYFGCLCLDNCVDRRLWSAQEMEVLATGARAIGSALLRRKLADQLMQARAEEERADELAKANAAMNRILTLTARETGMDSLLSSVLAAITEQFDTPLAEWWEAIDANTLAKRLSYLNGRLLSAEEMQGHHGVPYFKLPAEVGTVDNILTEPYLCDELEQLPYDEVEMEKIRAWYGRQGLSKFFNVLVKVDGCGVGSLLVFLPADRTFTETQIQFASGMAQHLALAIMIAQRAEVAQEAIIAREREQAAQERAEELAIVNNALTQRDRLLSVIAQITQELLENPDVEQAIIQAIEKLGRAAGASRVNVLWQKPEAQTHRLQHHVYLEWAAPDIPHQMEDPETHIINNDEFPKIFATLHAGQSVSLRLEDYPTPTQSRLKHIAIKVSGIAPIFIEEEYFGCLCFDNCVDRRLWSTQEMEVLTTGARAIGAALLRQRLIERVIQTQAEQERAAELARANNAMNRILTLATRETEIASLINNVLAAIAEHLDTPLVEWWEKLNERTVAKRLCYLNGRLLCVEEMEGHLGVPHFRLPAWCGRIDEALKTPYLGEDVATLPFGKVALKKIQAWYVTNGVRKFINVQVKVDGQGIGSLVIFLAPDRSFTEPLVQFASAMAQHLALAILIANRAEEAKQAVIAREREQAAQAQAAELAEINEALTQRDRLLSVLAQVSQELLENPNVEQAIDQALQKLGQAAGADRLNLLQEQIDPVTQRLQHHVILEWTAPNIPRQIDDPYTSVLDNKDVSAVFNDLYAGRSLALYLEDYPESIRPYFARLAIKTSGIMPVFVGDDYFGCLCFDICLEHRTWSDHEIDVLTAAASAIGAALLRQKLAEQLMQARAEEERADELAKANIAMNRILTLTARETGIDSLLSSVLAALAEQLNTPLAEWWEEVNPKTVAKRLAYLNGRLLSAEEMEGHLGIPSFQFPKPIENTDDLLLVPYLCDDIEALPYSEADMEKIRAWYIAQGLTKFFSVRVKVDGHGVGYLAVLMPGDRTITEIQIQFASGMAQHLALAIMIAKRAEAAQQAIIAHEREQAAQERVAELAGINEALTQRDRLLSIVAQITKDLLENPNVEQAIEQALQQLGQATRAQRVNLLEQRQDIHTGQMQHVVTVEWATPNIPRMIDNPDSCIVNDDDYAAAFAELHAGRPVCIYLEDYPEPARTMQAQLGVKSTGVAPIFIEGEYFGCLGFDNCVEPRLWSDYEKDVLSTGAGAIGAAIRRQQLIHQLVEERTQADQERVAQLEQTNQSLQRTIGYLNENPSLQAFLHAVLQEALTVSDAITSAVFTYDAASHTLQNIACVLHGEVVDIATDPRMEIWRAPVPADITPAWALICHEALWIDNDVPSPAHWPMSIPWHHRFGHKTIVCMLLSAGNEPLGFLGLAFATAIPSEEIKLAQCRALAQQVSLALRLESLSQQATQSALLEERNRMAGEIHDTLAQSFTGINFQINLAKRIAQAHPEAVEEIYDRIAQLAQNGLAEARRSVWSLYSANEAYESLEQDLRHCLERIMGTSPDVRVEIKTAGVAYQLPETIGKNLLRIGQEAITNILKHAQATLIEVEIRYQEDQICLLVKDNGHGFSLQENHKGFGLVGMTERAERINGHLMITTGVNEGTQILIQVPLPSQR